MRTSLVALLAAASASLLTACPLAGRCGPLEREDATYRRGADVVLTCANGGFIGTIGDRSIEGRLRDDGVITDGATNGFVADFAIADGWQLEAIEDMTLEKMNFACENLAAQPWWTQSEASVPVATVFAKDATCADGRGDLGEHAIACQDLILVCPDARAIMMPAVGASYDAGYTLSGGHLAVTVDTFVPVLDGMYRADGTFVSGKTRWTARPAAQLGLSCD